jgi:hypothetical protein
MEGKCIIEYQEVYLKPHLGTEVERVAAIAKRAVVAAAEALGVEGNFKMTRSWLIERSTRQIGRRSLNLHVKK